MLIALTIVFDNVIVGIGLVDYDETKILGLRVPFAPIEDFSYTLGAVMLVPAAVDVAWPRRRRRRRRRLMIGSIVRASRPVSWINTAYPFAAGYIMVERQVDAVLIVGTLFFLIPYNLLMYGINDVFDYESDLLNPRKGGIEGDVVRDREQAARCIAASSWPPC